MIEELKTQLKEAYHNNDSLSYSVAHTKLLELVSEEELREIYNDFIELVQ
jgi:hypothetical protein